MSEDTSRMFMDTDGKWHWERRGDPTVARGWDEAPELLISTSKGFISEVDCAEDYWKVNGPGAPVLNYERPKRA
jgi:hypothetical protein